MRKILGFQLAALLVVVVLAAVLGQSKSAVFSAMLGGLSCLLPTAIMFVVVVWIMSGKADIVWKAQMGFIIGESLKILLSVILLALCVTFYSGLIWIWFLLGLICVSKFIYFVMWNFGHYGSRNRKSSS